jgi:hypothetical protein
MRIGNVLKGLLVTMATLGFCLPEPLLAAGKAGGTAATDVSLRQGGALVGQVVDSQGTGVEGTAVSVRHEGKNLVTTTTGQGGYFAVKGLSGGVYQVVAAEGHGVYRLWTAGTAPPAAVDKAVLVAGNDVVPGQAIVLGQENPGVWKTVLTNPLIIAGIVATAIAVPVALHNAHHHHPASP